MEENATFKGFARVEVMGRQQHTGFVETQSFGGAVLFRIDRPEIPEAEETLTQSEWIDNVRCPAGSVVKRGAIPAATVFVGAGSIYRLIPCDEATAVRCIRADSPRPMFIVKLADDGRQITAGDISRDQDPDDDQEDYYDGVADAGARL